MTASALTDNFAQLCARLPGNLRRNIGPAPCPRCDAPVKYRSGVRLCTGCGYVAVLPGETDLRDWQVAANGLVRVNYVFGSAHHCFYCGEPPDERDHVIPWSLSSMKKTAGSRPGPRCFACGPCNRMLTDKFFPTLEERFFMVQRMLRDRGRKLLRFPDWSGAELNGLGHTLRCSISATVRSKNRLEKRLAWQESTASRELWVDAYKGALHRYPEHTALHTFLQRQA